jgi:peptide/nickel transport system permease protein
MTTAVSEQTVSAVELGLTTGPRVRRRFGLRSGKLITGIVLIAVFILMGLVGPLVAPYDPSALGDTPLAAPSFAHWLGTTQTGQDVLSQLLVGTQQTLIIGLLAGAIATALSAIVGIAGGFLGGAADEVLSLITNVFLVLPALPLLIVLTGYIPSAGPVAIAVVISLTGWAWGARVMRAQTLSLRKRDYVEAASIAGDSKWRIILFEILPNQRAILASSFLFTVLFAILTQVGLAFLGLVDVSQWSWGVMLYWAQQGDALGAGAYWWFIPPGLCVALLGTGLALANFGLDEYINPRLRIARDGKRRAQKDTGFTPVRRSEKDKMQRATHGMERKGAVK